MVDRVIKGKFKVLAKLGQGGMGAVYLAEQMGIGQKVALKFLKSEYSSDPELARRFLNEAKSYARVAHPNAVALHDFGQDDEGNLFIAMEYCEGVDLKKVLAEQGRLPVVEAIDVVLQVADVLANAHEKGVIHRDLKPENIMIRRGLRGVHAKVLDFGIARLLDAGTKLTMAGAIAGTPRYMSPEQVEGKEAGFRADVYSLGIVLYESLTGRQPFDGVTVSEILRKQVMEPLPRVIDFAPDIDLPELEAVLQRACAKRAEERWPDMVAFAHALSKVIPTQASLASPVFGNSTGVAQTQIKLPTKIAAREPSPAPPKIASHEAQAAALTELSGPHSVPELRSRKPMWVVATLGLAAVGGVAYWAFQSTRIETPVTAEAAPQLDTKKGVDAAEAAKIVREQSEWAKEENRKERARGYLGKGKTSFEVGDLEDAEIQLRAIAQETPKGTVFDDGQALLKVIDTIRNHLKAAAAAKSRGRCDEALPLYQAALRLNAKVVDAQRGQDSCQLSRVSPQME